MKEYAVREDHLYRKTYAKGAKASSRTVSVYVLKDLAARRLKKENPQKIAINRVGLTATKKIGGAVQRNRAKRVMREAYRQIKKRYPLKTGFLVIIVAHPACVNAASREVEADLLRALQRLDFILPETPGQTR